jgi:hypothetical protein
MRGRNRGKALAHFHPSPGDTDSRAYVKKRAQLCSASPLPERQQSSVAKCSTSGMCQQRKFGTRSLNTTLLRPTSAVAKGYKVEERSTSGTLGLIPPK